MENNPENLLALRQPQLVATKDITSNIVKAMLSGEIDCAKGGVILKQMEEAVEEARKDPNVKRAIIEATKKYIEKGKTARVLGYNVTVGTVSTNYDFKAAGHPELNAWYELIEFAKARVKVLEDELKAFLKESEAKAEKAAKFRKDKAVAEGASSTESVPVMGLNNFQKTVIIENVPTMEFDDQGNLIKLSIVSSGEVTTVTAPAKYTVEGLKYSEVKDKSETSGSNAPPVD